MNYILPVTLDLYKTNPTINAKQNDAGSRYILATITANGVAQSVPETATVSLKVEKADGTRTLTAGTVTDGKILVELTNQTLAAAGTATCELQIIESEPTSLLKTLRFFLNIETEVYSDTVAESTDEFTALTEALAEVNDFKNTKEDKSNKVTSIDSESTDTQYPSAKLVYDQLALKEPNLPVTPSIPAEKFLNGNKAWATPAHNKITDLNTDANYQHITTTQVNKLTNIEENAEVNIIETISIDNVNVAPTDRNINLVLATAENDGMMSSEYAGKLDSIAENANNYVHPNHTGDVTSDGDGATTIANDAVTNAKLSNVPAMTLKGNNTGATADPVDLSVEDTKAMLDIDDLESQVSSLAQGSPAGVYATVTDLENAYSTGDTSIYLVTADGNWYYWNGTAWTAGGLYQSPLTDSPANTIKGNNTGATAPVKDLTVAQTKAMLDIDDLETQLAETTQQINNLDTEKANKSVLIASLSINDDLNNLNVNESCTWGSNDSVLNAPDNEVAGFVYCYGQYQKYQICIGYISRLMYYRVYNVTLSAWSSWITLVTISDIANVLTNSDIVQTLGTNTDKIVSQNGLNKIFNEIIKSVFNHIYVTDIPSVIKEANCYANALQEPISVGLVPYESYDSYWFYANKNLEIYFDNNDISNLSYVSICVGATPSGTWDTEPTRFMRCSNSARYRKSDNNLPTIDDKLSVTDGSIIVITVPVNQDCKIYINNATVIADTLGLDLKQTSGTDTTRAMSQKATTDLVNEKIAKKCIVKYETGTFENATERLLIYTPTTSGYIRYNMNHYEKAEINADSWGIYGAYAVDSNLENAIALTTPGEWECALHLEGRPDFSGGITHGDEIYSNLYIFVDGKLTQLNEITTISFDELRIVEDSTLYDPNDNVSEIASHGREYIFSIEELKLNQNVTWKVAESLTSCYMAMFPPAKTITNAVYTNLDFIPYNIPVPFVGKTESNVTKSNIYSSESGFFAEFEITKYPTGLPGGDKWLLTDNGGGDYNKMYYIICNSGASSVGEQWNTTTHYKLTKSEVSV